MFAFRHLRTRLLVSILAVVFLLTAAVLIGVQERMKRHVRDDLVSTLRLESAAYADFVRVRREQTQQSAAMIADQPSVKALMSTNDPLTVQDGSAEILQSSGADLLILENANGGILAFHSRANGTAPIAPEGLMQVSSGDQDWWSAGGHLYDVSFAPITAGSGVDQHLLGRVALGRDASPQVLLDKGGFSGSAYVFARHETILLSSLKPVTRIDFGAVLSNQNPSKKPIQDLDLGGERYLASFVELPGTHPVRLYCLESFDQAASFLRSLNLMLLSLGAVAVIAGALLAFLVSRQITQPIEQLAIGTQRLKQGDFEFQISVQGSDEVAELTEAFNEMQKSLQQSREGLLRSARLEAVGRLAAGVAHDFNNLVMIIKGYSDLLLDTATPGARGYIEEIKNAGDRASALTRQLLAFSRKQVLEPQVLDPNQTVQGMIKMLRLLLGEDIDLVTHFSGKIGRVKVDPGQLEQVIMNLAVNARDAMPNGGKLIIATEQCDLDEDSAATHMEVSPGLFVLMSVTDTGSGMDKETQSHIFEPFFTTKEPGKGTGLGLATVYGIVKQSNGHIAVDSEPGRGTTFKVYLPSLEQSASLTAPPPAITAHRGNATILLVEDEAPLRALSSESLQRLGYTVLSAADGIEALEAVGKHPGRIDIVVTDIVMPHLGGKELVDTLRRKHNNFGVIFMSGYTESSLPETDTVSGGEVLLAKPFSSELLAQKVNEVLEAVNSNRKARAASV